MKNQMKALMLTAALTGMAVGTHVAQAQPAGSAKVTTATGAGLRYAGLSMDKEKHACKGQNSCKGNGGCKSGDNGCSGKNSCKGKGGCATDGSKPPKAA
jgi:hypothetical protein